MSRKRLLFLSHRLPYPPNKGDKISTFNILRYFATRYDVHLGTFVDDPDDWQYVPKVREYCADLHVSGLRSKIRRLVSARALLSGEPLSLKFYADGKLQRWVDHTLAYAQPDAILVYSGAMAQFVDGRAFGNSRVLFEPEDVDSEKFRQYAAEKTGLMKWIYEREADRLLAFETRMATASDATVFVTEEEAKLFCSLAPSVAEKVNWRTQGVDTDYYGLAKSFDTPYSVHERPLVFVGAMDYWPNIQAAEWYVRNVFPSVRSQINNASFYIVGMKPTPEVRRLAEMDGVHVTGKVDDVRPYLEHAWAACLPLQIARGIQNKALEAMAMGKKIIASPEAMTGIGPYAGYSPDIVQGVEAFIASSIQLLANERRVDKLAREIAIEHFSWERNLSDFERLLFPPF